MRPSMRMRSPRAPARTRMLSGPVCLVFSPATAGMVPIWTKGPAVCDGVSFSAMSGALERRGLAAAQDDVEAVGEAIESLHRFDVELGYQAVDRLRVLDGVDDDAALDQGIALEIELRDEALHEGMAEDREMDMRRPPGTAVVGKRIRPGPDGAERVSALGVADDAPAAAEIGIERRHVFVVAVAVFAAGVGLPDLDQRAGHRTRVLLQHAAMDDDALADRIAAGRVVADEVIVQRIERRVAEHGRAQFPDRLRHHHERAARRAVGRRPVGGRNGGRMPAAVAWQEFGRLAHFGFFRLAGFFAISA